MEQQTSYIISKLSHFAMIESETPWSDQTHRATNNNYFQVQPVVFQ